MSILRNDRSTNALRDALIEVILYSIVLLSYTRPVYTLIAAIWFAHRKLVEFIGAVILKAEAIIHLGQVPFLEPPPDLREDLYYAHCLNDVDHYYWRLCLSR